jgi:DNA polymerase V
MLKKYLLLLTLCLLLNFQPSYAAKAGEKLREQKLAAGAMSIFVTTSLFIKNKYFNSHAIEFAIPPNDTTELIRTAISSIDKLYRSGCQFKKCGVILIGLVPEDRMQRGLFNNAETEKAARLMRAIDAINAKVSSLVSWAVEGINQPWQVKFKKRSNRYTTRWDELPVVE